MHTTPITTRRSQKKRPINHANKKITATKNTRVFGKTQNLTPPTQPRDRNTHPPDFPKYAEKHPEKKQKRTPKKARQKHTHTTQKQKWKTIHTKQRALKNLLTPRAETWPALGMQQTNVY
jgi:hypothetical protein